MSAPQDPKFDVSAEVIANVRIAPDVYILDLRCPDLAPRLGPGQFVQLRCSTTYDPFLRRPFSICDHVFENGTPVGIRILYLVVGRGTGLMAGWTPGVRAEMLGPLGGTFLLDRTPAHAVFVAGGIGVAPFPALARHLKAAGCREIDLIFGARTAGGIYYVDEFEALGVAVHPATEDGSLGHRGFVTGLLRERLASLDPDETEIYACGPNPMFKAMGPVLADSPVRTQMSLEREMACGFGVCNGCVVKVRGEDGPIWAKVCTDGLVFDASRVLLEEL